MCLSFEQEYNEPFKSQARSFTLSEWLFVWKFIKEMNELLSTIFLLVLAEHVIEINKNYAEKIIDYAGKNVDYAEKLHNIAKRYAILKKTV